MNKLAICFSGQGSQYVHMGMDFIKNYQIYDEMANKASKILGFSVKEVLNDESLINQTRYTQPLITLKSIFGYDLISKLEPKIDSFLGLSLGEYSAYYAADVFSFSSVLEIISKRAIFMEEDTLKKPGMMAAIIGIDKETVQQVCQSLENKGVIAVANDNAPGQYVISGEVYLVRKAIDILKIKGARRAIELKTSGAFHTSLMSTASEKIIKTIEANDLLKPKETDKTIYMNFDAKPLRKDEVLNHIKMQMTHEVQLTQSIKQMRIDGITHILEIGPGKVLTNLIHKIDPSIKTQYFDQLDSYETVKGWLKANGFTK